MKISLFPQIGFIGERLKWPLELVPVKVAFPCTPALWGQATFTNASACRIAVVIAFAASPRFRRHVAPRSVAKARCLALLVMMTGTQHESTWTTQDYVLLVPRGKDYKLNTVTRVTRAKRSDYPSFLPLYVYRLEPPSHIHCQNP